VIVRSAAGARLGRLRSAKPAERGSIMDTASASVAHDEGSRVVPLFPALPKAPETDRLSLAACSLCLRVLSGSDWVDAEDVIRRLRSFEQTTPPRLAPALCASCVESIRLRRIDAPGPIAA